MTITDYTNLHRVELQIALSQKFIIKFKQSFK